MRINETAKMIHDLAWEKGWHSDNEDEDTFIERACNNLHDEVSELHEAWRNNRLNKLCDKAEGMRALGLRPLTCKEEEFADIIIRALDNCLKLGIDPENIIYIKHRYNMSRTMRHGGKRS